MMAGRILTALGSLSLMTALAAGSAFAGEARVLDAEGRVLTVGNWRTVRLDSGPLRVEDQNLLSYELRDPSGALMIEGVVPETDDGRIDGTPAVSLNPRTGELLIAWSRESGQGTREIVTLGFADGGFTLPVRVLAAGATNQTDPDLLHDRNGHAYLAWRDMDWSQRVVLAGLDAEGEELFRRQISTDETVQHGAPRLGVDATGSLFVAYLGLGASDGEPRLKVHAANEEGGGVIHVPNPIIELGRVSELPVVDAVPAPGPAGWDAPALEITVMGATPIIWWLTEDDLGREVLNHAIRTSEGAWTEQPLGRISLPTLGDPQAAVRDALEMIEARYRSVVSLVGTEPPGLEPGQQLNLPGLSVNRR